MKYLFVVVLIVSFACKNSESQKWKNWKKEAREHHRADSLDFVHWEDSIKKVGYRMWCLSEFGIHANHGYVGKQIQALIDSALLLPGLTDLGLDEDGNYCTIDSKGLKMNMRSKNDVGFARLCFCPKTNFVGVGGDCDSTNNKKPF